MPVVTGLFDDYDNALTAVNKLQSLGIDRAQISLVANNTDDRYSQHPSHKRDSDGGEDAATGAGIGAALGGAGGLLAGLGLMAIPGIGPVVAAGWLAATGAGALAGAAAGGAVGGMVGAMTSKGVSEHDAHFYAESVRRGGTVVSAQVDDNLTSEAQAILDDEGAVEMGARERVYQGEGWSRFDVDAPAYTPDQIAQERARYRGARL